MRVLWADRKIASGTVFRYFALILIGINTELDCYSLSWHKLIKMLKHG